MKKKTVTSLLDTYWNLRNCSARLLTVGSDVRCQINFASNHCHECISYSCFQ